MDPNIQQHSPYCGQPWVPGRVQQTSSARTDPEKGLGFRA